MNQFELKALKEKFAGIPALLEGLDPTLCEHVRIKRMTTQLLEWAPFINEHVGAKVGIRKEKRAFMIFKDDPQRFEIKPSHDLASNTAHEEAMHDTGISVGEALLQVEDLQTVKGVVWLEKGFRVEGHYSTGDWEITVYLLPEDFTLDEWREGRKQKTATLLQGQIDEALQDPTDSAAQ